MARLNAMHKPGEKAPEPGIYYCYVCALRREDSTCTMERDQLFLACPKCLERKVAEWDLVWKAAAHKPGRGGLRIPSLWPGALGNPA